MEVMSKRLPEPFSACTMIRANRDHERGVARVPPTVRDLLGARPGDTLVFQEGCDRSVMLAALRGKYFVVSVERAEEQSEGAVTAEALVEESLSESFIESVERKLEER